MHQLSLFSFMFVARPIWSAVGLSTTSARLIAGVVVATLLAQTALLSAAERPEKPTALLMRYCGDCHAHGEMEGSLALDELLKVQDPAAEREKWLAVWKNLRSQLMPPSDQPQPTPAEKQQVRAWIEAEVFRLDPQQPDPGRVTIRRLNRSEYQFTIQDLFGVTFNTSDAFPADDTGYGFDTIGDVLSLSPLQVEKYLEAARDIMSKAIPTDGPKPPTLTVYPESFRNPDDEKQTARSLAFATNATVVRRQPIEHPGPYRLSLDYRIAGADTENKAVLVIKVGDQEVHRKPLAWDTSNNLNTKFNARFEKGTTPISFSIEQEQPAKDDSQRLAFQMQKLEIYGPVDGTHLVYPANYQRIFIDGPPPADRQQRTAYARKVLRRVVDRAFRRPVDEPTLDRLMTIVALYDRDDVPQGFEKGVSEALTAALASPRFLFRAEVQPEPDNRGKVVPIDEYALASRLSYFLWSSLPDEELFRLAAAGQLRAQLQPQVQRMLADQKSNRFILSFVGQWLQTRDVEAINIDARRILRLRRTEEASAIFTRNLRRSMREETEFMFTHIVKENRSALDLLTADYTFLNEVLANWYGIPDVKGNEMRKVSIPADSPRMGVLSQASFLLVTSNPTRTSPVKRGLFILDNLLGTPAPAPPPNVPELEATKERNDNLSMRELMVRHRADPLCSSCHTRMDPLGLALEEFDAIGRWRSEDQGQPIETAGQLITGEKFANVKELSQVIAEHRRSDFYTCLTEKLMTYALGRGMEYYDTPTVEQISQKLEADGGRFQTLLLGVIESPAFQMRRGDGAN